MKPKLRREAKRRTLKRRLQLEIDAALRSTNPDADTCPVEEEEIRPAIDGTITERRTVPMAYFLCTTGKVVRWYAGKTHYDRIIENVEIIDQFDTTRVLKFEEKVDAKLFAMRLGLKTWNYAKI